MKRLIPLAATVVVLVALTACLPPDPGPQGLYLGVQADIQPTLTPRNKPIVWGAAPPIDDHYGGTIYEGTSIEQQDPRPPLDEDGDEPLRMWVADPNDGRTDRPVILWFHGGGFAVGIDSMYGTAKNYGIDYARRGYVGISVEYRTDTTLGEGNGPDGRPPSLCQWVQDNQDPGDPDWVAQRDQCVRNIAAAQHDALAAVRWVRAHADQLGIDPNKVAVGGFSAGAVTASNTAYQYDDVGPFSYFDGDVPSPATSRPNATFGASGCTYSIDGGVPGTIGAGDVPIALIASELDPALPYDCVATTVTAARDVGLVAELISYCDENGHAGKLYAAHKEEVDRQWTTFLARELRLYSGTRPPSADPVCA